MLDSCFSSAPVEDRLTALFTPQSSTALAVNSALHLMSGEVANRRVLAAALDPQADKGVLGIAECADLRAMVRRARESMQPLVLLIDSAGARLDDGLPVLGALRSLMTELLEASLDGLPMIALLGRNVFGGASMLAFAAAQRCYGPSTLLAMSGPRVLQAGNGEERSTVIHAIDGNARARFGGTERLLDDSLAAYAGAVRDWINSLPPAPDIAAERAMLASRLGHSGPRRVSDISLDRATGTLTCSGNAFVGAADLLYLATLLDDHPGDLDLRLDCAGHSVRLEDERLLLTQYLVHLAKTVRQRARAGHQVRLTITGEISGGIYIAAAGAATCVGIGPGGSVRTLPQSSLDNIFSRPVAASGHFAQYAELGVADTVFS